MYKSLFLSLFAIGTSLTAEAQTIRFAYDKGGNRCERIVRQNSKKSLRHALRTESTESTVTGEPFKVSYDSNKDAIHIFSLNSTSELQRRYFLYDSETRLLKSQKITNPDLSIDMRNFSHGLYILRIEYSRNVSAWKIMK